jgi:uncharacterized lipoprotein YbaY
VSFQVGTDIGNTKGVTASRFKAVANGSPEVASPKRLDKKVAPSSMTKAMAKVITVELDYAQRVLVPRGSKIKVVVRDAQERPIFSNNIKTMTDAPPYTLEIPFETSALFPLQVYASLESVIGHKFSQRFLLQRVSKADAPVKVMMQLE